jgi:hypothetical protein
MFDIIAIILAAVILPVLINKTTEIHFDWLKPYLRQVWTGIFFFFSFYFLIGNQIALEVAVKLHKQWQGVSWFGYIVSGFCGAALLCGYWWFTGKIFTKAQAQLASQNLNPASSHLPTASEIAEEVAKKLPKEGTALLSPVTVSPSQITVSSSEWDRVDTVTVTNHNEIPRYEIILTVNSSRH